MTARRSATGRGTRGNDAGSRAGKRAKPSNRTAQVNREASSKRSATSTASPTAAALAATPQPTAERSIFTQLARLSLLMLIALCVAWEWWLAPLRPGGSLLVLKALPLLLALPGVARRRLYTLQWASMLVLLYVAEGIVRGMSDRGLSASLGWSEVAVSAVFFVAALAVVAPFKRAARAAKRHAENGDHA